MENQSSNRGVAAVLQDIDTADKKVAAQLASLRKLHERLARAKQDIPKGRPVVKLSKLASDLRLFTQTSDIVDTGQLAAAIDRHLKGFADTQAGTFRTELRHACEQEQLPLKPLGDGLAVGPFSLTVDTAKESVTLTYAKVPVAKDLPMIVAGVVKTVQELSQKLLQPPALSSFAGQLEEAMRVALARQKKSAIGHGETRVELPATYREMCFIRDAARDTAKSSGGYSLPRFVVELKSLIQSAENMKGDRRFRLETAVLENTKDSRKSVFVPNDPAIGYGEGTYYQAVLLTIP